ncbi:PREDICTED: potassium channel subfamily K member 5 isoform X1 [Crocodylus porosus]|nr:PREDICTED: potassium channel subfamily K member 5 isoform X1 [Crocodylus porosus]
MVDRGPLLTSAIIFYLSIGAAIFEVLEEPNWRAATDAYKLQKSQLLKEFPCLGQEGLDKILQGRDKEQPATTTRWLRKLWRKEGGKVVSNAAGQGVTITGNNTFNNWNWPNAVIFAATVITTIGYGNVSPKTPSGRLFCIFYGLFGVPLCLTWISALGKFFGGRAKRLGQFLTKRGVSLRQAQITCTAIFIMWGVLIHLVIPPFVFMVTEGWDYIEGLYFSFITITTIGFGDFVAGVNPEANYHALYRYFVELWIYLGLAWLSLFVNWKVSMFVEVHKAIKKRRKKRKESFENPPHSKKALQMGTSKDVNIFSFLSKKEETYNDLIKQIGKKALKSNNDNIIKTDHSKPNMQIANKDVQVTYKKSNSFNYDEVSLKLKNGHIAKHLNDQQTDSPLGCNMFVNQLDRISEEEGEAWDSRDCRPLIFENANITFVNEDDDEEQDISDDEETSKSSMDDNLVEEPETPKTLMKFSSSDESTFTSNELETSVPYEQLMNEYNTVNNGKATT